MLYRSIILVVCEFRFRHLKQPLKGGSPWSKLILLCRRSTYLYGTIYLISSSIEDFPWYQLRTKPGQLDTREGGIWIWITSRAISARITTFLGWLVFDIIYLIEFTAWKRVLSHAKYYLVLIIKGIQLPITLLFSFIIMLDRIIPFT